LNPDVEVINGTNHWKVVKAGHLIGTLPHKLSKEGLADNTKTQFRRAGIEWQ
jgi:hypothetical protein